MSCINITKLCAAATVRFVLSVCVCVCVSLSERTAAEPGLPLACCGTDNTGPHHNQLKQKQNEVAFPQRDQMHLLHTSFEYRLLF